MLSDEKEEKKKKPFSKIIANTPVYLKVYNTNWYLTYGDKIIITQKTSKSICSKNYNKTTVEKIYFEKNKKTLWVIEEIYEGYYGIRSFDKFEDSKKWIHPNFTDFTHDKDWFLFDIIKSKIGLYCNKNSFQVTEDEIIYENVNNKLNSKYIVMKMLTCPGIEIEELENLHQVLYERKNGEVKEIEAMMENEMNIRLNIIHKKYDP